VQRQKYKRRRACVPCYASLVKRSEREKRPGAMSGPDRLCNRSIINSPCHRPAAWRAWGHLLAHHLRQSVRGSHGNADGPHLYRLKQHLGLVRQPCRPRPWKAMEGAVIPTSTTVVSITSTTIVISQNATQTTLRRVIAHLSMGERRRRPPSTCLIAAIERPTQLQK
jgi:hypothetical protein